MNQRVLVFDSGVGGLSVWDEIRLRCPQLAATYLMDNARFPYGELDEQSLIDGACALIVAEAERCQPAAVIVACNTASTLILPALRAQLSLPVIGVVPAIKPAALLTPGGRIGLLATPGTIKRAYTQELISQFAGHCEVLRLGSSRLVALAEEKLAGLPVDVAEVAVVLNGWRQEPPDVVVLGCTHFPLLRDEIQDVLGEDIRLIDSGEAIARRLEQLLSPQGALAEGDCELRVTQINERLTRQWPAFAVRGFAKPQQTSAAAYS